MQEFIITLIIMSPFILFLTIAGIIKYKIKQRQIQKAVEKAISKKKRDFWKDEEWD